MAFTNFDTREINCKIVYFGAKGAGASENLRSLYSLTSPEMKSGDFEWVPGSGAGGLPFSFEFLPINLGMVRDYRIRLHLFTLPGLHLFPTLGSTMLKGIDGFVFVVDSRVDSISKNIAALNQARKQLMEAGYNLGELPRVIQYNQRDHENVVPVSILRQEFNPTDAPDQSAVATASEGTLETLRLLTAAILERLAPAGEDGAGPDLEAAWMNP